MPSLTTPDDFQRVRRLDFCYLCGGRLGPGAQKTRDHVPPRAVFAAGDREPPLVLPTHRQCNTGESGRDEIIGQLVALLHGKAPRPTRLRLAFSLFSVPGDAAPLAGLGPFPFKPNIWRWIRGFHAALYGEYLKPAFAGYIFPPLPASTVQDDLSSLRGSKVPAGRFVHDHEVGREMMTDVFKQHRHIGRTDRIACNRGRCLYECVWLKMDDGRPFCLFGLRLYNWEDLGDQRFGKRGCLGCYGFAPPANATIGTELKIPVRNFSPLDPFEVPVDPPRARDPGR